LSAGLFQEFVQQTRHANGIDIHLRLGGNGPPLLLLHGFPQTHVIWHKVAPELAKRYTLVMPDLRGYGDTEKPPSAVDHTPYSKRTMALDAVELMRSLGFEQFFVCGHDRGGRVGHRLAVDHPQCVARLMVLDISPTLRVFENTDMALARAFYHWFFLIQPAPMPERMIGSVRRDYLLGRIGRGPGGLGDFPATVQREYLRCFDARGIHGSCEDYRAAATIDLVHDRKSLKKKLAMPVLALWARHSPVGTMFDCLADWRAVAKDVRGRALDCGHFLPEERPREVLRELRRFLGGVTG